jgi:hypothetical protein
MQFTLYQRLQIGTLLAADRMCRTARRAGQAGQTATQIVSCPRRKRTRTDHLRRQDPSARWRCPYNTSYNMIAYFNYDYAWV